MYNLFLDMYRYVFWHQTFYSTPCPFSPKNRFGSLGTVVPALGDPRRERPPAMYRHLINVPTHLNVKLPAISGHLPNADADSHMLVVSTWYNGQCQHMPRFRW